MFLRSLTIKGFKSFADPVTIDLSPGVSVIVGPNGSGKSNIADAIAWVLGAQGPKTVRSSKMDEVIFAGAGRRGPLGRAEVSIVVDNSDGGLDLDLTEVTVTRTLFRSGESEYFLNGNSCRLIDLQDLLSDAGVGRQQHVIISQGHLDAILNAKPEDRREVIEEAAGITKFKKRRERTERRLASMEGDLARAGDLVREVKRQIRPLVQQAAKAKRQLELRDRISLLRRYIAGSEIRALENLAEEAAKAQVDAELSVLSIQSEISEVDKAIALLESHSPRVSSDDLFDLITRSEALSERLRSTLSLAKQKRDSLSEKLRASDKSRLIGSLRSELDMVSAELETTEGRIVELGSELSKLEAEEADFKLQETPEIAEKLQGLNARLNEMAGENGQFVSRRRSLSETIARVKSQSEAVGSRLARLQGQSESKAEELDHVRARIEELKGLREQKESQYNLDTDSERALRIDLDKVTEARSSNEVAVNSLQAKVSAFQAAIEEGRSRTQAKVLAQLSGFIGAIVDVIDIESGYEKAFAASVQGFAGSVLIKDLDSALEGLRYLKARNIDGSVISVSQFIDAHGETAEKPPLPVIPLREKISASSAELSRFLDVVLRNTFVVSGTLEEAIGYHRRFPSLIFATVEGERLGPDGLWTASRPMAGTGLALERALRELEEAERKYEASDRDVSAVRVDLQDASSRCQISRRELEAIREELAGLGNLPDRLVSDIEHAAAEIEALEIEQLELHQRAKLAEAELTELDPLLTSQQPILASLESEIAELQRKMKEQFAMRRLLDQKGADLELRAARLEQTRAGLERARDVASSRLAQEIQDEESLRSELASWSRALIGLEHVIKVATSLEEEASALLAGAKRERLQLIDEARLKSERLNEARSRRSQHEAELGEKRDALQLSTIRQSEAKVRLETMGERVRRELGIETEIAKSTPVPEGVHPTEAEYVLRQCEEELSGLGPINELAEVELSELTEKLHFLESQLEDIKSSRRDLGKVIRSIDSEMLQLFESAFADVAENFSSLFEQLFQGGKGRLVLVDPDELMQSGLDIEVVLPGKSIKRLSLLSGGERSLIALAFLFSVFRSRPSPFYILDEVEAALDDINLNRFLRLITSFGKSSQLLIISHQKRTMEVADLLYGVTMQEGGSTKVVSQKMSKMALNSE